MYRPVGVVLGVSLTEAARNGLCFVPYLLICTLRHVDRSLVGRGGLVIVVLWGTPAARYGMSCFFLFWNFLCGYVMSLPPDIGCLVIRLLLEQI